MVWFEKGAQTQLETHLSSGWFYQRYNVIRDFSTSWLRWRGWAGSSGSFTERTKERRPNNLLGPSEKLCPLPFFIIPVTGKLKPRTPGLRLNLITCHRIARHCSCTVVLQRPYWHQLCTIVGYQLYLRNSLSRSIPSRADPQKWREKHPSPK